MKLFLCVFVVLYVAHNILKILRYDKWGNKNEHRCKTIWIAMMRVLPPTFQPVLQQIRLRKVVVESRQVLIFTEKFAYVARFTLAQGKLLWSEWLISPCMAWLPRNFIQSEVSIHATCNNLICCKTGLNMLNVLIVIRFAVAVACERLQAVCVYSPTFFSLGGFWSHLGC